MQLPSLAQSPSSAAKRKARRPELVEREAFIRAAMEEEQVQLKKRLEEMHKRGIRALMRVSTLVPFGDWDYYFVKGGPVSWTPNAGQNIKEVVVPEGFVTDLASIPRLFWQALRPEGRYAFAAVVHDYLYWTQIRPRTEADTIFRLAMEDSKVDAATVTSIYQAVNLLGEKAWNDNARLRRAGERRLLNRLPTDFTVSWKNWKVEPDVFKKE